MYTRPARSLARRRLRRPVVAVLARGVLVGGSGASAVLSGGSAGASGEQTVLVVEHA